MVGGTTPLLTGQRKRLETKRALISHAENLQEKSEGAKIRNSVKSKEGAQGLQLLENPAQRRLHWLHHISLTRHKMSDHSALLSQIPGIVHGFGDKQALLPEHLQSYEATCPGKKQVHGTRIVDVTVAGQECGEADGFITAMPGILLAVFTADCLPVIFCRKDGREVAAVHAGWRGLIDGILEQMAQRINQSGDTSDWFVSVGPSAGACCYEVSQELIDTFLQRLDLPPALISPSHRHLDLVAIAEAKLRALGFAGVDRAGRCTICSPDAAGTGFRYTSFRRNSHQRAQDPTHPGISGRNQQSGIMIL
jgi:YfiH family protein